MVNVPVLATLAPMGVLSILPKVAVGALKRPPIYKLPAIPTPPLITTAPLDVLVEFAVFNTTSWLVLSVVI